MSIVDISAPNIGASVDRARAARAVADLLAALGIECGTRMERTAARAATAFAEMLAGVHEDPTEGLHRGEPAPPATDVIALADIGFRSVCAHHLLPFSGSVGVAYRPGARIVGIGGIASAIDVLSARPQMQESLAEEIADVMMSAAGAEGCLVTVSARHSCVADRGAMQAEAVLRCEAARGSLRAGAARAGARALLWQGESSR